MQAYETGVSILDRIVRRKLEEIDELRDRRPSLEAAALDGPEPRDFEAALRGESVSLIAEVKRRSPGAGDIRPGLDPVELASSYEGGGASAVSVLTDATFFGGALDDLAAVRGRVGIPVLRKDFILDELQVLEARAAGADAVLLIVRILEQERIVALREAIEGLGMTALVEAHDGEEVERALDAGARVLGINNRDLSTFRTDLGVTLDLVDRVPEGVVLVSESGISSPDQVDRLGAAGVDAILVGEGLLRDREPGAGARRLSGRKRAPRPLSGA